MNDITKNEMTALLTIFKNQELAYNASALSKILGMSAMGALKILKRLEKEEVLFSYERGKAVFYEPYFKNPYVRDYLKFLLRREAENPPTLESKIWIKDIREEIKSADAAILFGSILTQGKNARDVDVLFIIHKKRFAQLNKEIKELNQRRTKKIHPLFQTWEDLKHNIQQKHKPLLNAIKGVVICGEDSIVEALGR